METLMAGNRSLSLVKGPIVLCILDGWGIHQGDSQNAITLAKTPNWDSFISKYQHSYIQTSGLDVGLPKGQMGNSEVGHMAIGSGRIVMQDLPRIDAAIEDKSLEQNPAIHSLIADLKMSGKVCHLLGLLSPGGVHSHQHHMAAVAKIISKHQIPVYVHVFLDGRDTPPISAKEYVDNFKKEIASMPGIRIATAGGRYYGMDRDKRWDRVQLAYDAIVSARGEAYQSIEAMLEANYSREITDEFMKPAVFEGYQGIQEGDALVMANFRADRVRQILDSMLNPEFKEFPTTKRLGLSQAIGMTEYSSELNTFMQTLFPPDEIKNVLGQVLAEHGLKQLRIAETEKYAHVTFFFNGGREELFPLEDRILVASPKVATYDLKPEMSAHEVTDKLIEALRSEAFDVLIVNFANTDMVGHSGILPAAIKAVETVDECLGKLASEVLPRHGALLVTADHGNAEEMRDVDTGSPHTAHTLNPVPFLVVCEELKQIKINPGRLSDIAPSLLYLLGIPAPSEMTGHSLITIGN